jgi:hypothetical protein
VQQLAQQVGRLSDTIGFSLEDLAREMTPAYLAHYYKIQVTTLERRYFYIDDEEIEVDLYGEGQQDGKAVMVVGEVRSRIYGRDVETVFQQASKLSSQLGKTPVTVLFCFAIHPSAQEAASRLGAILLTASGRLPQP